MDQNRAELNTQIVFSVVSYGPPCCFPAPARACWRQKVKVDICEMLASWLVAGAGLAPGLGLVLAPTSSIVSRDCSTVCPAEPSARQNTTNWFYSVSVSPVLVWPDPRGHRTGAPVKHRNSGDSPAKYLLTKSRVKSEE